MGWGRTLILDRAPLLQSGSHGFQQAFYEFHGILGFLGHSRLAQSKCQKMCPSVLQREKATFFCHSPRQRQRQDNDHSPPLADKDLLVEDCPVGAEEGDWIERLSVLWLLQI